MIDNSKVLEILSAIAAKIEEEKGYLTELDQPIGDSDHGINLARGFGAVAGKLESLADKDLGMIMKTVGMTLVSTVGGAAGPLYGSAYMKAAGPVNGKMEMDLDDFINMLTEAIAAVEHRGKSTVEEATMLDAMVPSLEAIKAAKEEGKSAKEVLEAGSKAAWAGAEHTKDLVATKGRASYVGERGLGHQDPGATSYSYMLETIYNMI